MPLEYTSLIYPSRGFIRQLSTDYAEDARLWGMDDATRAAVTAKHLSTVARCLGNADAALTHNPDLSFPRPASPPLMSCYHCTNCMNTRAHKATGRGDGGKVTH